MPKYIMERWLYDGGRWQLGIEFEANDLEDAKRIAMERYTSGINRITYGKNRLRILEVVFDGLPEETGRMPDPTDKEIEMMGHVVAAEAEEILRQNNSGERPD